jgi:hypothetical protein
MIERSLENMAKRRHRSVKRDFAKPKGVEDKAGVWVVHMAAFPE